MPLTSNINLRVQATHTNALDLGTTQLALDVQRSIALADGTAANQANQLFSDTRTLSANASEDLDLAGVLTNAFGATITFTKIKAVIITAAAGNNNNVIVGNAASNGWVGPFGAATHTVSIRPGGIFAIGCADNTAYAVTAGTGDLLKIANSAGGSSVSYDIVVIGIG